VEKVDLKKTLKHLYQPTTKKVVRVAVPAMNFLMVDGQGDPNTSQEFADAVEVLFSLRKADLRNWKTVVRQPMQCA
jgi:hypothetical protein